MAKRGRPRKLPNPALDLFGDVVVTWDDVGDWLEAVPRIARDSYRAPAYIRGYDVINKIKSYKLAGQYDAIIARGQAAPAPAGRYWERFSWARS